MPYIYSNPARENDPYALPDIWITQLTAREVAEQQEDAIRDYARRPKYRLAFMNARVMNALLDAMIEEEGITGGWGWYHCLPGCMPDSDWHGPFDSYDDAVTDARENSDWWDDADASDDE
jgi:hypothetical protein